MSQLAGALSQLTRKKQATQCQTCIYRGTLDAEDAAAFTAQLVGEAGSRVSARDLADFLAEHGGPSAKSIEAHRSARHV